jgi:AcrR family transcriptional regulator
MPQRSTKLSAADRKEAILGAATPIFARMGRAGATTKDIAKAAGISEALLYKHFPAKEALYAELERHCVEAGAVAGRLLDGAKPSTATLVMGVAVLVQAVFPGIGARESHDDTKRLVTSSLLGDGRFAKAFLDRHVKPWVGLFADCIQAAKTAGDLEEGVHAGKAEIWFVHHLANTLHLISLADADAVDYGMGRDELTVNAVRFLLRGLGLKNAVIDRLYDPDKLKSVLLQMVQE